MKQLHLIGTAGNNLCLVQIPTSWSQQEVKEMLERALLVFIQEREGDNPEFLISLNEEELRHQFPRLNSKLIEQVSVLLQNVGTPISTGGGLTWQVEVQNYLLRNPTFTRDLVLLFNNPLKKEEKEYLCINCIEALPEIVKVFKSYV
jgi:hypothetical protein